MTLQNNDLENKISKVPDELKQVAEALSAKLLSKEEVVKMDLTMIWYIIQFVVQLLRFFLKNGIQNENLNMIQKLMFNGFLVIKTRKINASLNEKRKAVFEIMNEYNLWRENKYDYLYEG